MVADYGDREAEYQAVRSGSGIADRSDLALLVVTGRDPVRMIQGLITNDLAAAADRAVYGVMLTPKGRSIAELRALKVEGAAGTEVWLILPREVLLPLTEHLRKSVPPLYARWRDASEEIGILGVYGPAGRGVLSSVLDGNIPELKEDEVRLPAFDGGTVRVIGTRDAGGEEGFDLLAEKPLLARLRERLEEVGGTEIRPIGFAALETLRIEAGRPRGGHELTDQTIATEAFEATGLIERAISFKKGCYTGQEVIVRIAHRGHVNRLLRGLLLPDFTDDQLVGSRLVHPETEKDVGWITSVTSSPLVGARVALAYVRREIEPGGAVRIQAAGGALAPVVALPFAAGAEQ